MALVRIQVLHLAFLCVFAVGALAQQGMQPLSFGSPKSGSLVSAGSTITITITSTDPTITQVAIFGESPLPKVPPQSGAGTFHLALQIPLDIKLGMYHLSAIGIGPNGSASAPTTIRIFVAEAKVPTSLRISPGRLALTFPGIQQREELQGVFQDGSTRDLSSGPWVTWKSQDATIATVDATGIVTAIGVGTTTIEGDYNSPATSLTTRVSISVMGSTRGDFNGDGRVDTDDLNILRRYLNTNSVTPNDARDLNHDGVINALDTRILSTLCTYPRCATRP